MSGRVWNCTWRGERAAMAMRDFGLVSGVFRCGPSGALWRTVDEVVTDVDPEYPRRAENFVTATLIPVDPHDVSPAYGVREVVWPQEAS